MGAVVPQQKEDFHALMTVQQTQQLDMVKQQQEFNARIQEQQLQFQQATNDRFDQLSRQISSRGPEGSFLSLSLIHI